VRVYVLHVASLRRLRRVPEKQYLIQIGKSHEIFAVLELTSIPIRELDLVPLHCGVLVCVGAYFTLRFVCRFHASVKSR
jgi:hypothetical protein